MNLLYPVVVFYQNGEFLCQSPSVGEVKDFCRGYISANNISLENLEIILYDRKEWISLLTESSDNNVKFFTENYKIKTVKMVESEEDFDQEIGWMRESDLEEFYTESEIIKIEENKVILQEHSVLSEELIASLPHKITAKFRKLKKLVYSEVISKEVIGQVLELSFEEENQEEAVPLEDPILSTEEDLEV
jgi:hypothetical protein